MDARDVAKVGVAGLERVDHFLRLKPRPDLRDQNIAVRDSFKVGAGEAVVPAAAEPLTERAVRWPIELTSLGLKVAVVTDARGTAEDLRRLAERSYCPPDADVRAGKNGSAEPLL